jgi:hypothetical protein
MSMGCLLMSGVMLEHQDDWLLLIIPLLCSQPPIMTIAPSWPKNSQAALICAEKYDSVATFEMATGIRIPLGACVVTCHNGSDGEGPLQLSDVAPVLAKYSHPFKDSSFKMNSPFGLFVLISGSLTGWHYSARTGGMDTIVGDTLSLMPDTSVTLFTYPGYGHQDIVFATDHFDHLEQPLLQWLATDAFAPSGKE